MFAESLKAIRLARGLTQDACAKLVGVAPCQYSSWESGRHEPRGESLVRLCEGLKVEPSELTGMRLEKDAVILWLVKQLDAEDRAMILTVLEGLVRRRGGSLAPIPVGVVRPIADQEAPSSICGEIVQPEGQETKVEVTNAEV